MQVRLEHGLKEEQYTPFDSRGFFAKLIFGPLKPETSVSYRVDIYIDLTEEEKQVVSQYNLLDAELEHIDYSPEEIVEHVRSERDSMQHLKAIHDGMYTSQEISDRMADARLHMSKGISVTVRDYLEYPKKKYVKNEGEALQYIDKVKTEVLPKFKELLQKRPSYKSGETFEV